MSEPRDPYLDEDSGILQNLVGATSREDGEQGQLAGAAKDDPRTGPADEVVDRRLADRHAQHHGEGHGRHEERQRAAKGTTRWRGPFGSRHSGAR